MAFEKRSAWRLKSVAPEVEDSLLPASIEKIKSAVSRSVLVSGSRLSQDAFVQVEDRALLRSNLSAACWSEAARGVSLETPRAL